MAAALHIDMLIAILATGGFRVVTAKTLVLVLGSRINMLPGCKLAGRTLELPRREA